MPSTYIRTLDLLSSAGSDPSNDTKKKHLHQQHSIAASNCEVRERGRDSGGNGTQHSSGIQHHKRAACGTRGRSPFAAVVLHKRMQASRRLCLGSSLRLWLATTQMPAHTRDSVTESITGWDSASQQQAAEWL